MKFLKKYYIIIISHSYLFSQNVDKNDIITVFENKDDLTEIESTAVLLTLSGWTTQKKSFLQ